MATADEILAGAAEVASEGAAQDKVLRIDNELRTISIPSTVKLLGVESDDDVNRIEFEMPRNYGEFDLSTFSVRVNYMNANGDGDIYKVIDLVADEEKMTFSWLVGRTAFMYKGEVQFIVCLKKIAEDFVVEQEFNTTVASLPVLQGLEPDEQLIQRYPDIIEQILKYMETPISSEEIGKAVEEYLKNNPVGGATINDDEVSAGSVWSSQKVSTQIDEKVSAHNTDHTAHTDVRELISGLTNRLNALADSDDTTLDQLSEIVAYIKSNKSLIDAITTSKVSVSDIVDDLITNSSNKPLSAAQGVKLKALIDAIVPITVDSVLSLTSTNPVQNKVVLSGLNEKENKGAARSVQIGNVSYTPNESGVIDLSSMTAPDSSKLGGKAPEYYMQPRNLLDNSNFASPVNQRGQAEYTGKGYTIDRWSMANAGSKLTVTDGGVTLSPNGGNAYMAQSIDDSFTSYLGKTYTFAVMTADGVVHTVTGTMPTEAPTSETILGSKSISSGTIYILVRANETCPTVQIRVNQGSSGVALIWAALYEGTYTADTLPSYRPRAASVELLECQRYLYIVRPGTAYLPLCWGLVKNASTIWYNVVFPTRMRVIPTFTYGGNLVCNASVYDEISDLSIRFADTQRAMLAATAELGAQVPDTASVLCGKAADAYLMFSAEM